MAKQEQLLVQLLTPIDEAAALILVADGNWWMQEKHDGRRLLVRKVPGSRPIGINRLGEFRTLPSEVADAIDDLIVEGGFLLDGELVDKRFYAFDLLEFGGVDLRSRAYGDRFDALAVLLSVVGNSVQLSETFAGKRDKSEAMIRFLSEQREGVVFKRHDAIYEPGRLPVTSSVACKLKFHKTASFLVTKHLGPRSVAISLHNNGEWQEIGRVAIYANQVMPKIGDVVEVRFLYIHQSGRLCQPRLLNVRDDILPGECLLNQLPIRKGGGWL